MNDQAIFNSIIRSFNLLIPVENSLLPRINPETSLHPPTHPPTHLAKQPPTHLAKQPPTHPSTHPPIHPPIHPDNRYDIVMPPFCPRFFSGYPFLSLNPQTHSFIKYWASILVPFILFILPIIHLLFSHPSINPLRSTRSTSPLPTHPPICQQ